MRITISIAAGLAWLSLWALAQAGSITATIQGEAPQQVWAVERRLTPTGVELVRTPGQVHGQRVVIGGLPDAGRFDLLLQLPSGMVEGWDASAPASDYEPEQPLDDEAKATLRQKIARFERKAFFDRVEVLDMQGNIQNAAVLVYKVHTRGFVEAVDRGPDWVWRVDRMQWEDPEEHTWTPHPKLAFYALQRHRVTPSQFAGLRWLFARHLGGVELTPHQPDADLGTLIVPAVPAGVGACNPDGTMIPPVQVKPDPQEVTP